MPISPAAVVLALMSSSAQAQAVRPSDLVAAFESTEVRPILAEVGRPQAYGGLAAGGVASLADGYSLPIGGGVGFNDHLEAGVDLAVGIRPFDALERARAYGRVAVLADTLAVQLGAWLPTQAEETLGVELMLPARWEGDVVRLYGQARVSASPAAGAVVAGTGGTVVARVVGPAELGLDLGAARRWAEGLQSTAVSGAPHLGVSLGGSTLVRARWSLPALTATDAEGAWTGLDARSLELMVVRRFGG